MAYANDGVLSVKRGLRASMRLCQSS